MQQRALPWKTIYATDPFRLPIKSPNDQTTRENKEKSGLKGLSPSPSQKEKQKTIVRLKKKITFLFSNMPTACIVPEWDSVGNSILLKANACIEFKFRSFSLNSLQCHKLTDWRKKKTQHFLPLSPLISLLHSFTANNEVSLASKCRSSL